MHAIEGSPGEHISAAAKRLCAAASEHGQASLKFNDVTLIANAGDTADSVERDFDKQCRERHIAWINSPEGKASAVRRDAQIASMQERHDCLMRDLAALDFTDDVAVLDWLCAMQEPTDHVGVQVDRAGIVAAFARHGFEPNVNTGAAYRDADRDNSFRYLVGQALSTLQACAIHGMVNDFTARWKTRFVTT